MFHLAKNVLSSRHTWVPVLQRCFSAVALTDHKQIRTMECQNGEKVGNYYKALTVTILISFGLKSCTVHCIHLTAKTFPEKYEKTFLQSYGGTEKACMNIQDCFLLVFNDHRSAAQGCGLVIWKLPNLSVVISATISVLMHVHSP